MWEGVEMIDRDVAEYGLATLKRKGADKAECIFSQSQKWELNVEAGEISLMRTNYNSGVRLKVIKAKRQGITSSNKTDRESIDSAAASAVEITEASEADPAYGIAEMQDPEAFVCGPAQQDVDTMYARLSTFLQAAEEEFPRTIIEQVVLDFTLRSSVFLNSNGVDFTTTKGLYNFWAVFTSKEGKKTSSFNQSGASTRELGRQLMEYGSVHELLRQSDEQIHMRSLRGKFVGDVIITPDCLSDFISYFTGIFLSDHLLISGTSIFKDSLNTQVADQKFTLHSRPLAGEIANNYYVTDDGYKAQNSTIVESGVLRSFLLSLYGSRKTGKERGVNDGGAYVFEPGDRSLEELVKSVERGVLLCRFSGGYPSWNGDFSGVAKNSYYIERGEIQYPIEETMVSGNLADVFRNIKAISKERINFGSGIFPWLMTGGFTISGR
jgi:PmbA protein